MNDQILLERASEYARLSDIDLLLATPLGHGTDGSVWKSTRTSAVKALDLQRNYNVELECYKRFKKSGIARIQGFSVPQLMGFSDELLVIEMRIVTPPFILNFAKAWLDGPPDFSAETLEEWDHEGHEKFEGNWREVKSLLASLRRYGIYYYDAKPANIMFPCQAE